MPAQTDALEFGILCALAIGFFAMLLYVARWQYRAARSRRKLRLLRAARYCHRPT